MAVRILLFRLQHHQSSHKKYLPRLKVSSCSKFLPLLDLIYWYYYVLVIFWAIHFFLFSIVHNGKPFYV